MLALTGEHAAHEFGRSAVAATSEAVNAGAVVQRCPAAGHSPMQETPPRFAGMVERFVRARPLARAPAAG